MNKVSAEMYSIAVGKGFHDGEDGAEPDIDRIAAFVANLHGEASELWEAARRGELRNLCDKACPPTCAAEELADIVIRATDMAVSLWINLGDAIAEKAEYNRTRPHRNGGKLA